MIKKITHVDGRVEEISGSPAEIAEYEGLKAAPSPQAIPEVAQADIERWRKIFEDGLRQGPQCGEWYFSAVDGDPVDQTLSVYPHSYKTSCGGWVGAGKTSVWVPGLKPFRVG